MAVNRVKAARVFLPITLLRRREFVVKDDEATFFVVRELGDFLHLARANQVARAFFADAGNE